MSDTLKNILVGGIFLVLVALGYYMITQNNAVTLTLEGSLGVSGELLAKTQGFIERRGKLESLELDTTLFTDIHFTSLRSYTTEVPDQPLGRINIFDVASPVPTTRTAPVE